MDVAPRMNVVASHTGFAQELGAPGELQTDAFRLGVNFAVQAGSVTGDSVAVGARREFADSFANR